MSAHFTPSALIALLGSIAAGAPAADLAELDLERSFAETVHPFLEAYCFKCHNKEKQRGKLDLSAFSTVETVVADYRRWQTVSEKLVATEMPPEEATQHPTPELRRSVIDWIAAMRKQGAARDAGDPGPVLARRLSNAEYDYTIRDLTGVDIRPTRELPVDPANESGFDNSGESLSMSPILLKKYLDAARRVAEHVVLKPKGFVFAPHPVVTETDRDKYCVQRIIDFYSRQRTDLADYFLAALRFKHRAVLGRSEATLAGLASAGRLGSAYLATIWSALEEQPELDGPMATLQALWRELPIPAGKDEAVARAGCEKMREDVISLRKKLTPEIQNLEIRGISGGSQPFVLWKDREMAANRRRYVPPPSAPESQPDAAGLRRFCSIFPDAFFVQERGLVVQVEQTDSHGRLLSAGFHLMFGLFRDDKPLQELILDEAGRLELDTLWRELDFIALAPLRQYRDFVFFERAEPPRFLQGAEFDFARSEDRNVTNEAMIRRLAEAYLDKARKNGGAGAAIRAIEDYFKGISADIRSVEEARLSAEPSHLEALQSFAERAYRRPLTQLERDETLAFYRTLRGENGLSHEEALRDSIVSVLMSPGFCYRVDLAREGEEPRAAGSPNQARGVIATSSVSDVSLASRLSYFLWSSMPDEALLACAAAGDLHRPEVLVAQARRMMKDDRIRGLATELGGNWLDFRRFEEHNSVDRERFKSFTNELRRAMFEEPIRFFVDLVREDRSVLEFLDGGHTFVNSVLAAHYGMSDLNVPAHEWIRVNDARRYGRGGLLPMSVFLTKNAPGLRTSPVKRGYWVVRRLLGEIIPPPPPTVPELPADEGKLGDLTLREALARHREDRACAGCHARFDGIGLVFEGYGPVGELREKDFGGRPVDTRAVFPGGSEGNGLEGLRDYIRNHRQGEFVDNLCRKLLAYALTRSLILPDEVTLEQMRTKLVADGYRFSSLIESIITSPQFLRMRAARDPSRQGDK